MNIAPIGVINCYKAVNFSQNKSSSNLFLKNNCVDTVSFSGKRTNNAEARYKCETRQAKLCENGNKLDKETASVLNKLDRRTNEFVERAINIDKEAINLKQAVQKAYEKGNITSSELSPGHVQFLLPFNKSELQVEYDTIGDKVESISKFKNKKLICTYSYNLETGALERYSASDNSEVIEFQDKSIEISVKNSDKETDFRISYILGNISYAGFEDRLYDNTSDPNHKNPVNVEKISKSAVGDEHSCQVAYALYKTKTSNSSDKKSSFLKWISYQD